MKHLIHLLSRTLELMIAAFLAAMVVLVFGNVVLRYGFNAGITVSEEVSRWLFIWLTFLGATVAIHERSHLGTDLLVSRLPLAGKKLCLVLGHLLMLYINWVFLSGSLEQARINWNVSAPITGAPMAIVYLSGAVFSVLSGLLLTLELVQALSGQLSEAELVTVKESEEQAELEALQAELATQDHRQALPTLPHKACTP